MRKLHLSKPTDRFMSLPAAIGDTAEALTIRSKRLSSPAKPANDEDEVVASEERVSRRIRTITEEPSHRSMRQF
jgi:hypothetical protein